MSHTPLLALLVGFFSSLHCFAMCGSIISALSFSLPADIRENKARMAVFILAYNSGRLFSYAVAGMLAGGIGGFFIGQANNGYGHLLLNLFSSFILVVTALYLAQWLPHFAKIEKLGKPIWQLLEPLGRRLLPIKKRSHAFIFGAIWGWLPCSVVYIAIMWAATNGDLWQGGLLMLAFGIGTLPAMFSAGLLSGTVLHLANSQPWRMRIAVLLLFIAAINLGLLL